MAGRLLHEFNAIAKCSRLSDISRINGAEHTSLENRGQIATQLCFPDKWHAEAEQGGKRSSSPCQIEQQIDADADAEAKKPGVRAGQEKAVCQMENATNATGLFILRNDTSRNRIGTASAITAAHSFSLSIKPLKRPLPLTNFVFFSPTT